MDFSGIGKPTADKHSTGGVGDKITLPLAPLVACFGVAVPQLSGRGLGHTGGTLDKLEAIPGWRAAADAMRRSWRSWAPGCGAVICAAGSGLAPADKKLYALRDITSTVDCDPAHRQSSIMSKKIAEGTGALVLDVKVGSGAFMKDLDARPRARLAPWWTSGADAGVATRALLTDMSVAAGHDRSATPSRWTNPSRSWPAAGPRRRRRADRASSRATCCDLGRESATPTSRPPWRTGAPWTVWRDDDPRAGRRPGRAPAARPRTPHQVLAEADGIRRGHGRPGRGRRLVEAGRRPRRQGRPGPGGSRHRDPRQAGRARHARAQPLLTLHTDDEWRIPRALESLSGAIEIADGVAPEPRQRRPGDRRPDAGGAAQSARGRRRSWTRRDEQAIEAVKALLSAGI